LHAEGGLRVRILDERRGALVEKERRLLERLISFLGDFGAPKEDAELVRRALDDLEEMFLLVIVGEFNSGKSAFVNALLGADIAEEGVTPTTDRITVLRHADEPAERTRKDGVFEKGYPNDFLREISIVDTPGTNAIIRHHEELSRGFVPRSDLVLFVTSAERPLTESERGYLELIRDWGKKILLAINKADLLVDEGNREEVRSFVADTEELVDERVDELVDWMVDRNLKQWRTVVDYVNRRRQADYDERLIGEVGDAFEYNRGELLRSVGRYAHDVVQRYDRERESEKLALSLQGAVTQTAALEVGAVGIGAVVVAIATTRFLDVTGIIAGAILAGYGLFILPNRRRKAREEFREKTEALRERLGEVVSRQFEAKLGRSIERMREAIAPYTRFVRSEHARMSRAREDLAAIDAEADALRAEIPAPGAGPTSPP
jgi:small GTP-binding protein